MVLLGPKLPGVETVDDEEEVVCALRWRVEHCHWVVVFLLELGFLVPLFEFDLLEITLHHFVLLLEHADLLVQRHVTGERVSAIIQQIGPHVRQVSLDCADDVPHVAGCCEPVEDVDEAIVILYQASLAEIVQKVDLAADAVDQQVEVALQ